MEEQEIQERLRSIEERIMRHDEERAERIGQHQQSLRSHTERVIARAHEVKELSNTGGFEKQRKYLTKIQKSIKNKADKDKT
jgi:hypothetical protein